MKAANTLVILSDEHQARALSVAGHPLVKTPHLDRLAARGTRFTNAVTPCPICVPARAAFATGLPVHACRYWDNSFGYDGRLRGWGHALQEAKIPVELLVRKGAQHGWVTLPLDLEKFADWLDAHLRKGK